MKLIQIKDKRINHQAIKSLEFLLKKAKEGDLDDFCYVGKIKNEWVYKFFIPDDLEKKTCMIGMLEIIKKKIMLLVYWSK